MTEAYSLERVVADFEEFLGRDLTHHERLFFDEGYRWGRRAERHDPQDPATSQDAPDG